MRKLLIVSLLTWFSVEACFGQLVPQVDERVELTGVVFRLSAIPEFTIGRFDNYNEDIDEYFADFRFGDLTAYVVQLRNEDRLGYAAATGSSMFLAIDNGHVIPNPALSLSELPGLGQQWKDEETFRKYVELLDDFYTKSEFRKFFDEHRELYEAAKKSANEMCAGFNGDWFTDFFGVQFQYPNVYVALGIGPCNYYIIDKDCDAGYAIVIGGKPNPNRAYTYPAIIHEICHNYSNPLFYQNWPRMEQAAEVIYEDVKEDMYKNAYGDAAECILEWQNNLFTAMYLKENEPLYEPFWTAGLRDRGFIWLPRSVAYMDFFYENRDKYPHIDSFMPQLVYFLDNTAREYDKVKAEFHNRHPYVVSVFPANGSCLTDGDYDEIKVRFSKPMSTDVYGFDRIRDDEMVLKIPRPDSVNAYWEDDYTFVIPIDKSRLQKNKKYGLILKSFMTPDYIRIDGGYEIIYEPSDVLE